MQTFMQFIEGKANRYSISFENETDNSEIELSVIFPIFRYIQEYLEKVGLWTGRSSPYAVKYKNDCMIISPTSKFMDVPEENKSNPKVTGNGLLKKIEDSGLFVSETVDGMLLYNTGEVERLFKLYFKKLTGFEDDSYWTYWTDLNAGIQCLLRDGFSSIKHEIKAMGIPSYKTKGEVERVISIKFAYDSSLDERKLFGPEFDPIYEEMPKMTALLFQFYVGQNLTELKDFVTSKITEEPPTSKLHEILFELNEMIDTAIRKKAKLIIQKF